jgi:hypothetical protein
MQLGMMFAKPYPYNYRRHKNADDPLKELTPDDGGIVVFTDLASPQTHRDCGPSASLR